MNQRNFVAWGRYRNNVKTSRDGVVGSNVVESVGSNGTHGLVVHNHIGYFITTIGCDREGFATALLPRKQYPA